MEAKPQVLVSVGFHGYVGALFQLFGLYPLRPCRVCEDGVVSGWERSDFGFQDICQHLLGCLLPSTVRTCHPGGKYSFALEQLESPLCFQDIWNTLDHKPMTQRLDLTWTVCQSLLFKVERERWQSEVGLSCQSLECFVMTQTSRPGSRRLLFPAPV